MRLFLLFALFITFLFSAPLPTPGQLAQLTNHNGEIYTWGYGELVK